jgi:hypothetical protein
MRVGARRMPKQCCKSGRSRSDIARDALRRQLAVSGFASSPVVSECRLVSPGQTGWGLGPDVELLHTAYDLPTFCALHPSKPDHASPTEGQIVPDGASAPPVTAGASMPGSRSRLGIPLPPFEGQIIGRLGDRHSMA